MPICFCIYPPTINALGPDKVISLGVVNGRNIWKNYLNATLDWLEPLYQQLQGRLWLAPSCSLLHVPVDLNSETKLDSEFVSWLSFARQKLEGVTTLASALRYGRNHVEKALKENTISIQSRKNSDRVHNQSVQQRVKEITPEYSVRTSPFSQRSEVQQRRLGLPLFPTTTIGSFPQIAEIRKIRRRYRQGLMDDEQYNGFVMRNR